MKWQPIETAPKGINDILLYDTKHKVITTGHVYCNGEAFGHSFPVGWQVVPTHWMPLPAPPND